LNIVPGSRCQIVSVHHPAFDDWLWRFIVVVEVDGSSVRAHDDKPVTYRINRFGKRVADYDPRCVQTYYSIDQLRVLS